MKRRFAFRSATLLCAALCAALWAGLLAGSAQTSAQAQIHQTKIENPDEGYLPLQLGRSISIDGDTMVSGAATSNIENANGAGLVRVYTRDTTDRWSKQTDLIASDKAMGDALGFSAALWGDTVIAGAHMDDDLEANCGAAYIFTRSGSQWAEQAKLTADDMDENDLFGIAVAIYGDTAIVGANLDDDHGANSGAAYIFTRSGTEWTQQAKLTASDGAAQDNFGSAVAIWEDTVIVGAYMDDDNGTDSGTVYVFTRSGSTWTQQAKLTAADGAGGDNFGNSVSICADTAIIGAYKDDGNGTDSGAVYVFTRSGTAWAQQAKLAATDAAEADAFGQSVSIRGDTAVAGAPKTDGTHTDSGAAYVFTRSGSQWTQQAKLTDPAPSQNDYFGVSAALDEDTLAVGETNSGTGIIGSAFVFDRNGQTWTQQTQQVFTDDAAQSDHFGNCVGLWEDTAIIGKSGEASACVCSFSGQTWVPQQKLTSPNIDPGEWFAHSAAIWGDTIAIGAPIISSVEEMFGKVYIFERDGSAWSLQAQLSSADANDDWLGCSVSIWDNTLLVGSYSGNIYDGSYSSAYVFTRSGQEWTQQARLTGPAEVTPRSFGSCVAIHQDTAIIGAPWDNDNYSSGSAYVFTRSGSTWTQQAKLMPQDLPLKTSFGCSVAVWQDTAVVGAYIDNETGERAGAAYIFTRNGSTWTQQAKLTASDATPNARFGHAVAIQADMAVIGATGINSTADIPGHAYIFTRSGSTWTEQERLTPQDSSPEDGFGYALAVNSGRILVGAPYKSDPEPDAGAAYVFDLQMACDRAAWMDYQ